MTALERINDRLTKYYAAETAILEGAQAYTIGSRAFTKADLQTLQSVIKELEARQTSLTRGGIRMRGGIPA